jgi:DNA-binding beta-propeller fold protein YncE
MTDMIKIAYLLTFMLCFTFSSCSQGKKEQALQKEQMPPDTLKKEAVVSNGAFKDLQLVKLIQSKDVNPSNPISRFEPAINSPKSAIYAQDGSKFYINSLEGYTTAVFDAKTLEKIKEIRHEFTHANNHLFKDNETTVFDYQYKQQKDNYNEFLGKPVESCLSHDGKYLWVTYYRRNWDPNAESPSAVAIIDTKTDQIVRVMPSGPLPKMIACSPDNKYIAVTHWGDNTVGLIDISSAQPMEFKYVSHIVIDHQVKTNFTGNVDRDNNCSNCLRGTVFTDDEQHILVAKMGGNGIAVIDLPTKKYIGTITGSYQNLRHIVLNNGYVYLSSNKFGAVQRAQLASVLKQPFDEQQLINYKDWQTVMVGPGARTIDVTADGKYTFACVNNACKVVVIDNSKMEVIHEIKAEAFPVGMALSPDNKQLIVTSQGKDSTPLSGNAVMIFEIEFIEN